MSRRQGLQDSLLEFGNSVIRTSWKGTAMLEEGRWDNAHVVAKRVSESDEKEKNTGSPSGPVAVSRFIALKADKPLLTSEQIEKKGVPPTGSS